MRGSTVALDSFGGKLFLSFNPPGHLSNKTSVCFLPQAPVMRYCIIVHATFQWNNFIPLR
jgi:hypothetical protein